MVVGKTLVILPRKNKSKHSTIITTTITIALMLEKRSTEKEVRLEILTLEIVALVINLHVPTLSEIVGEVKN